MTFPARTLATIGLTAALAVSGAAAAPVAQAADFYGAGSAECPAALAQKGTGLGFVTSMGSTGEYFADIDLGATAKSAAWVRAPRATWKVAGETLESWSGYVVLDAKGGGWFVRQAENGMLLSKTKLRGPWAGLRMVVGAAQTGDPTKTSSKTQVLYGVTTSGTLVRMPVTWNAKGVPGVGARQTVGGGYRDYLALRFTGYTHTNHTPNSDQLVGITSSGRFNRIDVTRGSKPKASLRVLARSGFSGLTDFVTDQCWQDGTADAWIVKGRNGSLAQYVDPNVTDTSLRGLKKRALPGRLPAGVRLL